MFKRSVLFAALLAIAAPASATLQLSTNINGTLFNCADQAACDTDPLLNRLRIGDQTIAGVEIVGSSQFETAGTTNFINTSSFQFINHNLTDSTVQLAIGGTGFIGPINSFSASGSGTWQSANASTIALFFYGDAANGQGADTPTDFPGTLLASFSDTANGDADGFGFSTNGPFAASGLHSMTLGTSGTITAWDGGAGTESVLVGRSQTILTTQVPEPATLALLGLGLLAFGATRVRRS